MEIRLGPDNPVANVLWTPPGVILVMLPRKKFATYRLPALSQASP